jgi:hypothetical protein
MRILTLALVFGAILSTSFASSSLFAQNQQQPAAAISQATASGTQPRQAADLQRQARRMANKLGLTSDQESKLEPILADRQQQVESAQADTTLAQKDKRVKIRSIRQESDAKIEAILSDTQKQQYEQMKESQKAKRQQQSDASTNS